MAVKEEQSKGSKVTTGDPTDLMDIPEGDYGQSELESIMSKQARVVEDEGGWTYLFKSDNTIKILEAPPKSAGQVGKVLTEGGGAYEAIRAKFGTTGERQEDWVYKPSAPKGKILASGEDFYGGIEGIGMYDQAKEDVLEMPMQSEIAGHRDYQEEITTAAIPLEVSKEIWHVGQNQPPEVQAELEEVYGPRPSDEDMIDAEIKYASDDEKKELIAGLNSFMKEALADSLKTGDQSLVKELLDVLKRLSKPFGKR